MNIPQPPHDIESEAALLGCILIDPGCLDESLVVLEPQDFYSHKNRWIWGAVASLKRAGSSVDIVTVAGELEGTNRLAEMGGTAYLAGLIHDVPHTLHAESYARTVLEASDRRRLVAMATDLAAKAYNPMTNLDTVRADLMAQLVQAARLEGGAAHIGASLIALYGDIQLAQADPREIFGIPTGFADFDRSTAGLQKTEVMILAGEPGMGKSLLAAQMAANMAGAGRPGVIYELEMGHKQLTRRLIAALSGVTTKAMRSGSVSDQEWPAVVEAFSRAHEWPLYVSDYTGWTTTTMRADLARLKKLHGIEWFVVDYFGLLQDTYGADDNEREKHMSGAIKRACLDLDLSALVVHSMNKTGMAAPVKRLMHLSGNNRLAFDADLVCFLTGHIPTGGQPENKNVRTLTFAKYREDDTNRLLHLVKRPGLPAFGDYIPDPNGAIKAANPIGGRGSNGTKP